MTLTRDALPAARADRDVRLLWAGQSVSFLGGQVTAIALPLTAAVWLSATPAQMGLLTAAGTLPFLVLGLPAGVWVDRVRRRPLLLGADVARACLLAAIPLLFVAGRLDVAVLLALALAAGICTMLSELAAPAYVPTVVDRGRLERFNAALMGSRSVSDVVGPGLAGVLVGVLTAPGAIVVDAVSFLVAAVALGRVRRREPRPTRTPLPPDAPGARARRRVTGEVREGLTATFGHPVLRAGALAAATYNLWWSALEAVLVIYTVRELGLSPGTFGLCFSVGAIGAVLGSLLTVPLARRLGPGPSTVVSAAVACCGLLLLVPLEGAGPVAPLLAAALFVRGLGLTGWNVQIRSLQQTLVPHRLLGRMNAAYLLLSYGAGAVGALAGGLAGGVVGLRTVLVVSAVGVSLAWFWLAASPLRTLRPHRAARADGPPDPGGS